MFQIAAMRDILFILVVTLRTEQLKQITTVDGVYVRRETKPASVMWWLGDAISSWRKPTWGIVFYYIFYFYII